MKSDTAFYAANAGLNIGAVLIILWTLCGSPYIPTAVHGVSPYIPTAVHGVLLLMLLIETTLSGWAIGKVLESLNEENGAN